jgi:uncharacterized protein
MNPVGYFEIPVTDMERAMAFYGAVFCADFERQTLDGYDMALFAYVESGSGATGALAKGDVYRPSHDGALIYFTVQDIDAVLACARTRGAEILLAKKDVGAFGHVAEIQDSEGNRIGLHQPAA